MDKDTLQNYDKKAVASRFQAPGVCVGTGRDRNRERAPDRLNKEDLSELWLYKYDYLEVRGPQDWQHSGHRTDKVNERLAGAT